MTGSRRRRLLLRDLGLAAAAGELAQAEDDELRRLDRRDADLAGDLPGLDVLGRVGLGVALDEERLVGRLAEQGARAPDTVEEARCRDRDLAPQPLVVG